VGNAPSEPRAVDRYDGVWPQCAYSRDGLTHPSQDKWCSRQHFGYSSDGEIVERGEANETSLLHVLATDPSDPKIASSALLQCSDQRPTKRVTGGFTRDKENEWWWFWPGHEYWTPTTNSPA
jgi:hypothetical protein